MSNRPRRHPSLRGASPGALALLLPTLGACTDPQVNDKTRDDGDYPWLNQPEDTGYVIGADTDTAGSDSGEETGGGTDTDGAYTGTVDCADLPEMGDVREVDGAVGYHDVIFDTEGYIIGGDLSSLIKADYEGNSEVYLPGEGYVQQMDWLPDGDMVVANALEGALIRFSPEGGRSTLTTDIYAYEVLVGPDGMIYAADNSVVWRVDPETGDKERLLVAGDVPGGPRVLAFSLDYTQMFIGTQSGTRLYRVELDDTYTPVTEPEVFADGLAASYHDGMALDVCGNIYVATYADLSLYRVTPDGEVDRYWQAGASDYGHGMQWGIASFGWREDALYQPRPYGGYTVNEVVIGVPRAGWEGEVLNGPE